MKKTLLYLFLLVALGCTKEESRTTATLMGKWVVVENLQDTGGRIVSSTPDKEAILEFQAAGQFSIKGNDQHYLQGFDRYQLEADGTLHFYNTINTDSRTALFTLANQLVLQYPARCYVAEKLVRTP